MYDVRSPAVHTGFLLPTAAAVGMAVEGRAAETEGKAVADTAGNPEMHADCPVRRRKDTAPRHLADQ